jgi:hypothetical protein
MKLEDWAREFYEIDPDDNDATCGEIDTPNHDTVFAWMAAFTRKVAREERERCTIACERIAYFGDQGEAAVKKCAAAIRSMEDL